LQNIIYQAEINDVNCKKIFWGAGMAIDREKFIQKYIDEGLEILFKVEALVFDIKNGISVEDDLATLLRSLHTLKGTSRMLEFKRIEELSHSLESVFVAIREQRIGFSENALKLILSSLDILNYGFGVLQNTKDDNFEINEYVKNLSLLAANEEYSLPITDKYTSIKKQSADKESVLPQSAETERPLSEKEGADKTQAVEKRKETKTETIRIPIEKIDEIIKSISSLRTLEIAAKNLSQNGAEIVNLMKDFSKSINEYKKHNPVQAANFRKLERLGERLNSSLKNYVIDAENSIGTAYDRVISLRTLPISTIFDSYPRYVYHLSQELGKKVRLTIEGKENEIDKNIIETISEVFIHIVRNALDHGIETPQERLAAGKNETGKLSIICCRESGSMKIIISDDGRGIDLEKIRQKAVRSGFVAEAAAANLTKEDLINFIFQSGFSTSGKVSSVSGRGVGMDVVRECIETLKGSIIVDTIQGEGSKFTITVPLSIAALMGFPIECDGMKFIIPANFVEAILLLNRDEIITVVDKPEIKYNDRIIKLYYLNQILQIKKDVVNASDIIFVVIVRSYEDVAAIAVNNIDSMRAVILKTMPAFMENMSIFSGIVLNEDYEMVSVLHIPTVIKMAKRIKILDFKKHAIEFEKLKKSILVVDDSLPIREIESEILLSEGYVVDTAADGAQALKAAKTKHYDLICTDLNLPVMDGFMFIEKIKKNEDLSKIPIIVISSKDNEEEQNRAYQLGASRYIVKNSFNNHNLLEAVSSLIGAT
jgi:chemotaxis protein histidine kinase CheA/ActR/RegA family two-component response regulator